MRFDQDYNLEIRIVFMVGNNNSKIVPFSGKPAQICGECSAGKCEESRENAGFWSGSKLHHRRWQ